MKAEIKAQWVQALRSGEYRQGQRTMRTNDGAFCCLGVLCDIHAKATGGEWSEPNDSNDWYRYMGQGADLPPDILQWAGLNSQNPIVSHDGTHSHLSDLNDGAMCKARTFAEIADLIEAQL